MSETRDIPYEVWAVAEKSVQDWEAKRKAGFVPKYEDWIDQVARAVLDERERCAQWHRDIAQIYVETADANKVDPTTDPLGHLLYTSEAGRHNKLAGLMAAQTEPWRVVEAFTVRCSDDQT